MRHARKRSRYHHRNPRYAKQWVKERPRWNGQRIKMEFNAGLRGKGGQIRCQREKT